MTSVEYLVQGVAWWGVGVLEIGSLILSGMLT